MKRDGSILVLLLGCLSCGLTCEIGVPTEVSLFPDANVLFKLKLMPAGSEKLLAFVPLTFLFT